MSVDLGKTCIEFLRIQYTTIFLYVNFHKNKVCFENDCKPFKNNLRLLTKSTPFGTIKSTHMINHMFF